jgi:plastocyanin
MRIKYVLILVLSLFILGFTSSVHAGIVSSPPTEYYSDYHYSNVNYHNPYPPSSPLPQIDVQGVPISIYNFQYSPYDIIIFEGTAVSWVNYDYAPHTVTSEYMKYYDWNNPEQWDSGKLEYGQVYSRTFNQPGTYYYYCTFHSNMRGVIHVISKDQGYYYPYSDPYQTVPTYYSNPPMYGYSGGHPDQSYEYVQTYDQSQQSSYVYSYGY